MGKNNFCGCHQRFKNAKRLNILKLSKRLYKNMTKSEKVFRKALDKILIIKELTYCPQHIYRYDKSRYFILDYYFESINLAVEIDGGVHTSLKNETKDVRRDIILANDDVLTLRIINDNILGIPEEKLIKNIKQFLIQAIKRKINQIHSTTDNKTNQIVNKLVKSIFHDDLRVKNIKASFAVIISKEFNKILRNEYKRRWYYKLIKKLNDPDI